MFQVRQHDVKFGLSITGSLNKRVRRMPGTVGRDKKYRGDGENRMLRNITNFKLNVTHQLMHFQYNNIVV